GRRRVDDDVARPQLLATRIGQPQAVAAEVDLNHTELGADELGEAFLTELFLEPPERGARQDLALEPLRRRPPRARTDRQVDPRHVGNRTQAFLDERLAEEAGAAGDQDGLALQGFGDHDRPILEVSRRSGPPGLAAAPAPRGSRARRASRA